MDDDREPMNGQPASGTELADLGAAAEAFQLLRPRLFGIAYRMLGSVSEAEDILQEVWIRWQTYDRSTVLNPAAFLATTTTRIAINVAQSARVRRVEYVGPWLPEPVDTSADPALGAERGEALEFAVLVLLEKLTPTERAAYVLREAFGYDYQQIADIIVQSPAGARQLVSRARKHLASEKRAAVGANEQRRLLGAFVTAARTGDLASLEALFSADVVSLTDGGGKVRASKFPVVGRLRVAKFVRAFAPTFWTGVRVDQTEVNGQPAVSLSRDGARFAVVGVGVSDLGIDRIFWLMNPDKLVHLEPAGRGR